MRIGGFVKQSFIDWEGKIAAVVFTKGCNFRCGYCHNPSLVLPKLMDKIPDISENEIINAFIERKQWLDGVVITGGEPTIHKDLKRFLLTIKQTGYRIKLDTNGSNPLMLAEIIKEKLADYIAMDIKTIFEYNVYKTITRNSSQVIVSNIMQSLRLLESSCIAYQLRTTVIPGIHSDQTIQLLSEQYKHHTYVLQPFRDRDIIEYYNW